MMAEYGENSEKTVIMHTYFQKYLFGKRKEVEHA